MGDLTGQTLGGRFRVEAFLGRGGVADVYRVWDEFRSVYLALKVLHSELAGDAVFLRRFEQEADTLTRLQHPNIVRCYGLESASHPKTGEALAFILMDFIDGLTLRQEIFIHKAGMPTRRVLEIMRLVCAALHFAHKQQMVHCDIKPGNMMISRAGTVFLTDFGIARVTEAATHTPLSAGTPAYLAPELIRGGEPSPAADIYALGVVLYEMVTGGQRPYTGEAYRGAGSTIQKIVWEKSNLPPTSPLKYKPDLSPAVEAVIMRCLENDPKDRYRSALELLNALDQAVNTLPGEDEPGEDNTQMDLNLSPVEAAPVMATGKLAAAGQGQPSAVGLQQVEKRLSPFFITGGVILSLAIIGFLVLGRGFSGLPAAASTHTVVANLEASPTVLPSTAAAAEVAPTSTTAPPAALTATPTLPAPTATLPPEPTVTGGSGQIAFASDRSGSVQIWIMDETGENRRQVTEVQGGACQPAWSPDGKHIVYTTPCRGPRITYPGSNLQIINLESGDILPANILAGAFDPAWSPDGETIVYTHLLNEKTVISAVTVKDGAVTKPVMLANRNAKNANPAWSPDGKKIAFSSVDKGIDQIWTMDRNGTSQELFSQDGALKYHARPEWSPDGKRILANLKELNINIPTLVLFDTASPRSGGQPLLGEPVQMEDGSFSPDGQWIVYWTFKQGDNMEIMRVSLAGEIIQMTNHAARDFHPAWGPKP